MDKIEHIGIAVRDLEKSAALFEKLLNKAPYKKEVVEEAGVTTLFFDVGGVKIELLEGLDENSPISRYVEKKGEGIHHIAFGVEDATQEQQRLVEAGFEALQEMPTPGADQKEVAFFHPKTTNGVLTEICSDKEN